MEWRHQEIPHEEEKFSVTKPSFIFLSPSAFHEPHFNAKNNLWTIYTFNIVVNRADQNPLPLRMPSNTVKLQAEPGGRVPGETERKPGLVGSSQTRYQLATSRTQEAAMPSTLSLDPGKTKSALILPASKHWMEPHAEQTSLAGSPVHAALRFHLSLHAKFMDVLASFLSL